MNAVCFWSNTRHCLPDPGPGYPLHPEEYQEEPGCEGLALVEALHHRAATDRGSAHRGADSWKRCKLPLLSLSLSYDSCSLTHSVSLSLS